MRLLTVGPDVNTSRWRYYGKSNEQLTVSNVNTVYRGTVVIGLMAIKGLSSAGAESIIKERERNGDYKSLDDFSRRVRLNRDDIIALCPAGVFDSIANGLTRPIQARTLLGMTNDKCGMSNGELFEDNNICAKKNKIISHSTSDIRHYLLEEYRALGFLRNTHPLALWKDKVLAVQQRVKALHIGEYVGRNVKMVGWPITQKNVWTKDGESMCFLSLEDETDIYETVVFPKVYDRYNKLLFDQQPLLVYGRVTDDLGAVSLEVRKIEVL
jgi:DNA polymerase-3 subunit alpha/error-prone DNA polymerase